MAESTHSGDRERAESGETALELEIAIVGGGVAGSYCAWRLLEEDPERQVGLFELSDRIGGRLFSRKLPGMPHVVAELGGMRYIPEAQRLIGGVIDHLGLESRPFLRGVENPDGDGNNLFLRRKHMRMRDLAEEAGDRYHMEWHERGKTPDEILEYMTRTYIPDGEGMGIAEQAERLVFGQPLYCHGFWNLLYRVLSSEAYAYVRDAGGYDTSVANGNAASSLQVDQFHDGVRYRTLVGGMDLLPRSLAAGFAETAQREQGRDPLFTGHRLLRFDRAPEGAPRRYRLLFARTGGDDVRVVYADRLILAMPRRGLELLDQSNFFFSHPWVQVHLRSVIKQAAFKLFLGYDRPWWRGLGLVAGHSITDLPVRQTFYFPTEGEEEGADPRNSNSLLMASYGDDASAAFWKAFEDGEAFTGAANPFLGEGEAPLDACDVGQVSESMVGAIQGLLRQVHGLREIPKPYTAAFQDWGTDPHGAAWHAWKAGFRYWEVMRRMRKPLDPSWSEDGGCPEEQVYICGEAYSNIQSWVEGALQTAEHVLRDYFELDRPSWLDADYDLGP